MRIIVNSVYPTIGIAVQIIVSEWRFDRESEGECHLIPEGSPCVSTQERPSQSWIVSFQRLGCTLCLNTITSFSPCMHLTRIHTLNNLHLFCFWKVHMRALCLPCSPYLSKLDAGFGCLTASVKLWCGCLILGSMHLLVFTIIILKKGGGGSLNGGTWFSSSSLCIQTSGVLKMDGVSRTGI